MSRSCAAVQVPTPEVLAWLASETARGCSRQSTCAALHASGWNAESVRLLMQLTPLEWADFSLAAAPPDLAFPAVLPPAVRVPQPVYVTHPSHPDKAAVDCGDRTVLVVQRHDTPPIAVFAALLSSGECDALVAAARPRLSASLTVDTQSGGEFVHPDRTSQGMFFTRGENALVARIEARLARLSGWPAENAENLQILRYPPGAQYRPHYDYFDPRDPGTAAIVQRGGQRVATVIIYLQEPACGGATVFPEAGMAVAPARGNAVFFSYAQAHPISRSLHGGDPVITGEKWIATQWLRERAFH